MVAVNVILIGLLVFGGVLQGGLPHPIKDQTAPGSMGFILYYPDPPTTTHKPKPRFAAAAMGSDIVRQSVIVEAPAAINGETSQQLEPPQ